MTPHAYLLHALSPLHAGVGQAAGLIDLPVARLAGTGIPYLPGSSVKGVLRDAYPEGNDKATKEAIFGPGAGEAGAKFAGALVCTDFRLLALPVRSFRGTFAYVTSPLLLLLAARDLERPPALPKVSEGHCMCGPELVQDKDKKVYLADQDLQHVTPSMEFGLWKARLGTTLMTPTGQREVFEARFAVVDDETMADLSETATQLDQRVRINPETRVVQEGALWLEESLPAETLLIGQFLAERSRYVDSEGKQSRSMRPEDVLEEVERAFGDQTPPRILQFGGKSTVGRGRCRLAKVTP